MHTYTNFAYHQHKLGLQYKILYSHTYAHTHTEELLLGHNQRWRRPRIRTPATRTRPISVAREKIIVKTIKKGKDDPSLTLKSPLLPEAFTVLDNRSGERKRNAKNRIQIERWREKRIRAKRIPVSYFALVFSFWNFFTLRLSYPLRSNTCTPTSFFPGSLAANFRIQTV